MRIICLVPSLTELIVDIGGISNLVGRTKYCIHPRAALKTIPKVGGTKKVDRLLCLNLHPDLIICTKEENTKEDIEYFQAYGIKTLLLDISSVDTFIDALPQITNATGLSTAQFSDALRLALVNIQKPNKQTKCAYLIWHNPDMTIGGDTYINSVLNRFGYRNVFDTMLRYPTVNLDQIKEANPSILLLSSEPYPFSEKHIADFQTALPNTEILLVDGEAFSWYGSRLLASLPYLTALMKTHQP